MFTRRDGSVLLAILVSLSVYSLVSSSTSADIAIGLTGYWNFDNDANDYSGQNKNGQIVGVVPSSEGISGGSYKFDGENDYIYIEPHTTEEKSYTVSVWFKTSYLGRQDLLNRGKSSACFYNPDIITENGKLIVHESDCNANGRIGGRFFPGLPFKVGEWNHVIVTRDDNIAKVYLNGKLEITDYEQPGKPANLGADNAKFVIGAMWGSKSVNYINSFNGLIDEVKVWNRPLTEQEIETIYKQSREIQPSTKLDISYQTVETFPSNKPKFSDSYSGDSGWTVENGNMVVENGILKNFYGGAPGDIILLNSIQSSPGKSIRVKVRQEGGNYKYSVIYLGWQDIKNTYLVVVAPTDKQIYLRRSVNDIVDSIGMEVDFDYKKWYDIEFRWVSPKELQVEVWDDTGKGLGVLKRDSSFGWTGSDWTSGKFGLAGVRGAKITWFDDVRIGTITGVSTVGTTSPIPAASPSPIQTTPTPSIASTPSPTAQKETPAPEITPTPKPIPTSAIIPPTGGSVKASENSNIKFGLYEIDPLEGFDKNWLKISVKDNDGKELFQKAINIGASAEFKQLGFGVRVDSVEAGISGKVVSSEITVFNIKPPDVVFSENEIYVLEGINDKWVKISIRNPDGKELLQGTINVGEEKAFNQLGFSIKVDSVKANAEGKVSDVSISALKIPEAVPPIQLCSTVCIKMWEKITITCPGCGSACQYIECGSGCGPDNVGTFKTEADCKASIIPPSTPTPSPSCKDYRYSACPANCVKKCTPSVCSKDGICTSDCEGPGSCSESTSVTQSPVPTPTTAMLPLIGGSATVSDSISIKFEDYKIVALEGSNKNWLKVSVEDKSGKEIAREIINVGTKKGLEDKGFSIKVDSVDADEKNKVTDAKITVGKIIKEIAKTSPEPEPTFVPVPVNIPPYVDLIGDKGYAIISRLNRPTEAVSDKLGNIYIADAGNNKIRKIGVLDKTITTFAGSGVGGYSGDGGDAISAELNQPTGIIFDLNGNVFIADTKNSRVRKLVLVTPPAGGDLWSGLPEYQPGESASPPPVETPSSTIEIIACSDSDGGKEYGKDGIVTLGSSEYKDKCSSTTKITEYYCENNQVKSGEFNCPNGCENSICREKLPEGYIITRAGSGLATGQKIAGGLASEAVLNQPYYMTVGGDGNLYSVGLGKNTIAKINKDGTFKAIEIKGDTGTTPPLYLQPSLYGLAVDQSGKIYISDKTNNRIRMLDPETGMLSTVAGTGDALSPSTAGFSGDGGQAKDAKLNKPNTMAIASNGDIYFEDSGNGRIRKIEKSTGIITTVASGTSGLNDIEIGTLGSIYLSRDSGIIKFKPQTGVIATISDGTITKVNQITYPTGYKDGDLSQALFFITWGIALDSQENIYVSDQGNNRIRKIDQKTKTVTTITGIGEEGFAGDGGLASQAKLSVPTELEIDSEGNLYVADTGNNRIRKIALPAQTQAIIQPTPSPTPSPAQATGASPVFAGTGKFGSAGDGGPASNAQLSYPRGGAFDAQGSLYFADFGNIKVRRIDAKTGIITTIAGNGEYCLTLNDPCGDSGLATDAKLSQPVDIETDAIGNVYLADIRRIRKVDAQGIITTIIGTGEACISSTATCGDGEPAAKATFNHIGSFKIDKSGNTYIADEYTSRIRRVDKNGIIITIAGKGSYGFSGDNGPATGAQLNYPNGIELDKDGNLYVADAGNNRIRKIDKDGIITTFAGSGIAGSDGDGGLAKDAKMNGPSSIVFDLDGNLLIADTGNYKIRKVDKNGVITTTAGTGIKGFSGDGGLAPNAQFGIPYGINVDQLGNIYISDYDNSRIRKIVDGNGIITTFAGTGYKTFWGDGGQSSSAQLYSPQGIIFDSTGNLYVADANNHRIRKIDTKGIITTIAGKSSTNDVSGYLVGGFSGDGGSAMQAELNTPRDMAIDSSGNIYIADTGNNRIRRLSPNADGTYTISTIAGGGSLLGDGELAIYAKLYSPREIALDSQGNIYVADTYNNRIRKIEKSTGIITTIAGTGLTGYSGDGELATLAKIYANTVAVDSSGNVYISDNANPRIRRIDAKTNIITTIAGTGVRGFSGDGGPAINAQLMSPYSIFVDSDDNIYISDSGSGSVRRIDAKTGIITSVAGTGATVFLEAGRPEKDADLYSPKSLAIDPEGKYLYITDGQTIKKFLLKASATSQAVTVPVNRCTDSDGKDYYNWGNVETRSYTSTSTMYDICETASSLKEGYCDNGSYKNELFACPNGCQNGTCKAS